MGGFDLRYNTSLYKSPVVGLTQRRWSIIGGLGLIIAGSAGSLGFLSQHSYSLNQAILTSKNTILTISELEGNLKDAETGQRGFLLTGEPEYLQPYIIGVGAAKANLAKLTILSENDYLSRDTVESVENFTRLKFAELEQTVELRRNKGIEAVLPIVKRGTGKTYMDFIRLKANRLRFLEETKLSADIAIQTQLGRVRNSLVFIAVTSGGIICLMLLTSFREELALRQKIEESQVARLEALRVSSQLKERELSLRIHDWKNPLTVIISSVEIILNYNERLLPEKREAHLGRILDNANVLLNGFDDALLVARAEAGKLDPVIQASDVITICKNSIAAVEFKVSEGRSIALYTVVLELCLQCDKSLLQRAIVNLLENAIKHTSEGEIAVVISKRSDWVFIQVADQGAGIPKDDLQRLFRSFERGNTTAQGTGLGLAVVKSCADAHNGWVKVESDQIGNGFTLEHPDSQQYRTVFTLALPGASDYRPNSC